MAQGYPRRCARLRGTFGSTSSQGCRPMQVRLPELMSLSDPRQGQLHVDLRILKLDLQTCAAEEALKLLVVA